RQAYEFWRDQLRPAGYRLRAMIVEWPGGLPGDVGFFLRWGDARRGAGFPAPREATMPPPPEEEPARLADQIPSAYAKFAQVYQSRCATALQAYVEATGQVTSAWLDAAQPRAPIELWRDVTLY